MTPRPARRTAAYSAESGSSDDAVAATARTVLTYQGATAFAQFSASDGGWTVAGQFSYLPAQQDIYEGTSKDYYGWKVALSDADIEQQWPAIGNLTAISIDARDGHGAWGGRPETITLTGDQSVVHVENAGDVFQTRFGLRSSLFRISGVSSASARPVPTD